MITHQPLVQRVIRWYDKYGDDFIGEKVLEDVNLSHLQSLFKVESINPMYDCYLIECTEQKKYLENTFSLEIYTDLYDYFIECDAI
ncbi:hypothetical protein IQ227_13245 [Anabaena aphanizomenioides LEGE 00250]|uniref:DUF7683 domain-containing protein n=2 Tax=Sphaerospermopsis TaxID=752201 RepID=A0A480A4I6_9CYAN|nr:MULTISPECIES: hypothetical protein [Sphaerospermopsis]MBE9236963.1 hypothetical protein [Sphaerospermopsis aphanizomenoides LEGE 00250]GCL37134.1 hypothetical protein SR1949_22410 [Sphaerospermopsis reniformis]